jgi:galactose oxidase-like protein
VQFLAWGQPTLIALTALAAGTHGQRADAQTCLAWTQRAVAGPSPRGEAGFAFDSARGRSVLVGGANSLSFGSVFRQTWEWDGAAWTLRSVEGPSARCDNAVAYDSARGVTVSFGGYDGGFLGDTWEWDGVTWTSRPGEGPSPRADSFMVFDTARGVMVLFGGLGSAVLSDTWEWDGNAWAQRIVAGPSPRWIQRMAYDTHRARTVLFGGRSPSAVLGETWEWDGAVWAMIAAAGPSPRYGHSMAYDGDRRVTLLFGGQTGFNLGVGVLGDTWEWDGAAWQSSAAAGPAARSFGKMVYDSGRRKAVVFGGFNGAQFIGDTWEFGSAYANCDGSSVAPVLNVTDFICFLSKFAAADPYANCDDSSLPPVLNISDFICFTNRFAAGCA